MKVAVTFGVDADIIDCPENIVNKLDEYRDGFIDWLFDKANDHSWRFYRNGEKAGCRYRSEAFAEWLNKFVPVDPPGQVKVVESCALKWDRSLPEVFF